MGLSRNNALGYVEYRPTFLHIGLLAAGDQLITLGNGQGAGGGLCHLDTDVDQVTIRVIGTGSSTEAGIPSFLWHGNHPSNVLNVIDGDVGVAMFPGKTALLSHLEVRAGTVELGPGVTLTGDIDKTGGQIIFDGCTINGTQLIRR